MQLILKDQNIIFKQFNKKYIRVLYQIRNHLSVRRSLGEKRSIKYQSHFKYVKNNLLGKKNSSLFVVFWRGKPIGIALLRNISHKMAEIGLLLKNPDKHPLINAYCGVIILNIAFEKLHLKKLYSFVLPANRKAYKINRGLGGIRVKSDQSGKYKFIWTKQRCYSTKQFKKIFERIKKSIIYN